MPLVLLSVGEAACAVVDQEVERRRAARDAGAPARFKMQYTPEEIDEGRRLARGDGPRPTKASLRASDEYFKRVRAARHALWKEGRRARPRASRVGVLLEAIELGLPLLAEREERERGRRDRRRKAPEAAA